MKSHPTPPHSTPPHSHPPDNLSPRYDAIAQFNVVNDDKDEDEVEDGGEYESEDESAPKKNKKIDETTVGW